MLLQRQDTVVFLGYWYFIVSHYRCSVSEFEDKIEERRNSDE
jgi:hypothetical protein